MTTIVQIKSWPLGQKGGGFAVVIKTAGKTWQLPESQLWMQKTVIQDETGEMRADFFIRTYSPIISGGQYHITIGIVQEDVKYGKKFYVDQFQTITQTADDYDRDVQIAMDNREREIRSKIKCWLVSAVEGRRDVEDEDYPRIDRHVEYIVK